ncbi:MAG: hypothetical protein HBSIN02_24290 [Bacteroidia bacterium]|nr:MAG: hypothetical protein HBSIN02_24290 [Bacteroidia bacterium]
MLLRILLWTLIVMVLIRFVSRVVTTFLGSSARTPHQPQSPRPDEKHPPVYKDVRDARYTDIPEDKHS